MHTPKNNERAGGWVSKPLGRELHFTIQVGNRAKAQSGPTLQYCRENSPEESNIIGVSRAH